MCTAQAHRVASQLLSVLAHEMAVVVLPPRVIVKNEDVHV